MISSNINCHLSAPVIRQKNMSRNDYLEERKKYFNEKLKYKTVTYKGKPTSLVFSEFDDDKCFNKFAAGAENNHTNKDGKLGYDSIRIERLDWIFEIIEKFEKCQKCGQIIVVQDKSFKNRENIYCMFNNYKIVININKGVSNNTIVTAYYIRTNEEKRKKARKKAYKVCS